MAERLQGLRNAKRIIKNIPDSARKILSDDLQAIGNRLLGRAEAETPVKSGGLKAALKMKFTMGVSMILRIGLLDKRAKSRYFYGYILDAGRKAYTRKGRHIGAIGREKYNFVFGRRADFNANELPNLRSVWTKILQDASAGGNPND
ncbi:hypothetical protein SAMN05444678_102263 [Sphingomonas sp. YR710]|uniref:hypothetical protein n=1 Tax=Sphingomonas sp. YR710 TaxID=1882773 RepID=UPI0008838A61|nr:hypothetical protein [Sphingomonas sp. YR710]SDC30902.1 hypothetical protein SAMN05444678_102263 [Sphingomonas sp. YR710]